MITNSNNAITSSNGMTLSRVFNKPQMIAPWKMDEIICGLWPNLAFEHPIIKPSAFVSTPLEPRKGGYRVTASGIAVVELFGVLAHRGGIQADSSYIMGYESFTRRVGTALEDPEVKGILIVGSTPGGETSGAFDAASYIYSRRGNKPIYAIADDYALSAGYLLTSAADRVFVTQSGGLGSIGVVMRHVDFSKALENDGMKVTQIFAGQHKIDGNPYEPLSEEILAKFQARVDAVYQQFISAVSLHTGISQKAIKDTEAEVFFGSDAVQMGLAHAVVSTDDLLAEMSGIVSKHGLVRGTNMSDTTVPVVTQEALTAASAEGFTAGVSAERERITAILALENSVSNFEVCKTLISTGTDISAASKILSAIPIRNEPAPVASNPFMEAMGKVKTPNVSLVSENVDSEQMEMKNMWASSFGRYS